MIPNIRFADERSYGFCCAGVEYGSTIAIGSHGCIKLKTEREYFRRGIKFVAQKLHPKTAIVYGAAPDIVVVIQKDRSRVTHKIVTVYPDKKEK